MNVRKILLSVPVAVIAVIMLIFSSYAAETYVPLAPIVKEVTHNSITVEFVEGYEYGLAPSEWQDSNVFTGLKHKTVYSIWQRPKGYGTTTADWSFVNTITLDLPTPEAPSAPVIESTDDGFTVTLKSDSLMEYSCDNGYSWQESNVFNLNSCSSYKFCQRIKAGTENHASDKSDFVIYQTPRFTAVPEGYTAISTKEELNSIRNNLDGKYILTNDIVFDASDFEEGGVFHNDGRKWIPIGETYDNCFAGVFEGNGYSIVGLKLYCSWNREQMGGLFGHSKGEIKNVHLKDAYYYASGGANNLLGGISGVNSGYIYNCSFDGKIEHTGGITYLGGITGYNKGGKVSHCENKAVIYYKYGQGSIVYDDCIGGIVGENIVGSEIDHCVNSGKIVSRLSTDGAVRAGGICGYNSGKIAYCSNENKVIADKNVESIYCGGIACNNTKTGIIEKCYNTADLGVKACYAAGIAVFNRGLINYCYNIGNIESKYQSAGIAAKNYQSVRGCFNTGRINSKQTNSVKNGTGGIVGYNEREVLSTYNLGEIVAGKYYGPVVGYGGGAQQSYYVVDGDVGRKSGAVGIEMEHLTNPEKFNGFFSGGWEFEIRDNENYPYPLIKDLPFPTEEKAVLTLESPKKMSIKAFTNKTIGAIVNENLPCSNIVYSSSDTDVATVSERGVIIPVKPGKTKIKAWSVYGRKTYEIDVEIEAVDINETKAGDLNNQKYGEKVYVPQVTLRYDINDYQKMKLVKDVDYKVSYKNHKKIGTATITVTGIGNFTGTMKIHYDIVPDNYTNPRVVKVTSSSATLSWDSVYGAQGYRILRYDSKKKDYVRVGATTDTSFTIKELPSGTKQTFAVVAYKKTSGKYYFGYQSRDCVCAIKPAKPVLTVTAGNKSAYLSWKKVTGTGYEVYMSTSKNSGYKMIGTVTGASKTTFVKEELKKGKTYYFKVRAFKSVKGEKTYGAYSTAKAVKIK